MGDRGQINVIANAGEEYETNVWLYTHWKAYCLREIVAETISKGKRWTDAEYLARMLFSEMTRGQEDEVTGFGIGNHKHGDVYRVAVVDIDNKTVTFDGWDGTKEMYGFEELEDSIHGDISAPA